MGRSIEPSLIVITVFIILKGVCAINNAYLDDHYPLDVADSESFSQLDTKRIRSDLNMSALPADTCYVTFVSELDSTIHVYGITALCYHCYPEEQTDPPIGPMGKETITLLTTHPFRFTIYSEVGNGSSTPILNFVENFGEHGVYEITIFIKPNTSEFGYAMTTITKPDNAYIPILIAFGVMVATAVVWVLLTFGYRKMKENRDRKKADNYEEISPILDGNSINVKTNGGSSSNKPNKSGRIHSLDTMRGICLTVMIFVNYGGGGYWFFDHSTWNGLTVADLVFPWFVFIMGAAMPLSFTGLLKRRVSKWSLVYKILRRTAILFALGLFVSNGNDLKEYRIPGVLQRFAISYMAVALIIVFVPILQTGHAHTPGSILEIKPHPLVDITPYLLQWGFASIFPLIHTLITFLLDVPGCGRGYLGPGGIGDWGLYQNCTGGAAGYIDKLVLGEHHMYLWPTSKPVYHTGAYDPEGLLGFLNSIFLCFLGVQVGRILLAHKKDSARLLRWTIWGAVLGAIALGLAGASKNAGVIPICKNLWSLSFIFAMAGTGFWFLSICYVLVDVAKLWNGAPFIYPGMNSIMVYVGSETLEGYFPFSLHVNDPAQHMMLLLSSLMGAISWLLVSFYAYVNDFFINI